MSYVSITNRKRCGSTGHVWKRAGYCLCGKAYWPEGELMPRPSAQPTVAADRLTRPPVELSLDFIEENLLLSHEQ